MFLPCSIKDAVAHMGPVQDLPAVRHLQQPFALTWPASTRQVIGLPRAGVQLASLAADDLNEETSLPDEETQGRKNIHYEISVGKLANRAHH